MPTLSASALTSELQTAFAAVQQHFHQVVVPLWQGPGWNPHLGLPYEALQADGVALAPQRYRAMACARQLYLFTSLIDTAYQPDARTRAAELFASLQRHFHDPQHGGWFYSIDAQGAPLDKRKDLYTHAFILFACAHYLGKVADPAVEAALHEALQVIAQYFADGSGLYHASLAMDWSTLNSGPLQNPLMHLAEAFLAVLAVRPEAATEDALRRLVEALPAQFVEAASGRILEQPLGTPDNWYEPGHQFEWFYLLASSPLLRDTPLHATLQRAFDSACVEGVASGERDGARDHDRGGGAVHARLSRDGQLLDATQRIWAQAEYLRALTLRPGAEARVLRQLHMLQRHFLHDRGWHECLSADGRLERRDMPSTTPYHLATCYAGLANYLA